MEYSSAKSAGLDPERVLEVFKGLQKEGALAKIVSEDVAKKIPTNNSSELDKFLSSHTPITLRLRAHLFHHLSGGGAPGGKDAGDANLIEDLQGDDADQQNDASSRVYMLASSPLPDVSYVPALTPSQRRHPGSEAQRDHLVVLVDVLLKALADLSSGSGNAGGGGAGAGSGSRVGGNGAGNASHGGGSADEASAVRAALLRTRDALVWNDGPLGPLVAARSKAGWAAFVEQSLAVALSGASGSYQADRSMPSLRTPRRVCRSGGEGVV